MERTLQNYIDELKSDVASLVYSEGEGASFEISLQNIVLKYLSQSANPKEREFCLISTRIIRVGLNWKINGYCLKDISSKTKTTRLTLRLWTY